MKIKLMFFFFSEKQ